MRKIETSFIYIIAAFTFLTACDKDNENNLKTPVPKAVDLGIVVNGKTVKWASFNLGASKPEEYGDYFAWGEVVPYYSDGHSQDNPCADWRNGKEEGYCWTSYKWCNGTAKSLIKYNLYDEYGKVDNLRFLKPSDDAARVHLGGKWRIPTLAEWRELFEKCTWEEATEGAVNGLKITGPNGNSIFLPLPGYRYKTTQTDRDVNGLYWTSETIAPSYATIISVDCSNRITHSISSSHRFWGISIRPVTE